MSGPRLELTDERQRSLEQLVRTWLRQRAVPRGAPPGNGAHGAGPAPGDAEQPVVICQVEVLRAGRPGLLDVIATVDGRSAHLVVGLRRPGEEARLLRTGDDPVLGLFDNEDGLAVAIDALRDAELAPLVLAAVTGREEDRGPAAPIADDDDGAILAFGDRCTLSVFPWLYVGPHPGVEFLVALDTAGFNHLPAPLALWRRGGQDLGLVQEMLAGSAGGWALALTSLRDLYGSGESPESAGGDFGPEARALGTMTARMHLALDRAFGRRSGDVNAWLDAAEAVITAADPAQLSDGDVGATLAELRAAGLRAPELRTHGDFHLGKTARTDQGWVVADCLPGGVPPGGVNPVLRSPLADVADMLWSLHHVATVAASERDPTGRSGLAELARAWETRNRRAFLGGYLGTQGIGGLVPADREVVRKLAAIFELERAAARSAAPPSVH
jgi:maltokinase